MKSIKDYAPEIWGVFIAIITLNLWYLSSLAVEHKVLPYAATPLIGLITAAIGAFLGAYFAFQLRKYEEKTGKTEKQKSSIDEALLILIRQANALQNIYNDLKKYKQPHERAFLLPAIKPPSYSDLKQNLQSLNFLIDHQEVQTILILSIEQERFEQAMHAIEIRNVFFVQEVQPVLSQHNLNDKQISLPELKELLGERLYHGSINSSSEMYQHIEKTSKTIIEMIEILRTAAKNIFPGSKFIGFAPPHQV